MTEKGTEFDTYTRLYKDQWPKPMNILHGNSTGEGGRCELVALVGASEQ
jgi:hypothetical protein